jgi:hypothetical protein
MGAPEEAHRKVKLADQFHLLGSGECSDISLFQKIAKLSLEAAILE